MSIVARDTDHVKLTRKLRARLAEQITVEGDCHIFHPEGPRRHIEAETYDPGTPTTVVSVSRLAYAFAHERCKPGSPCLHGDPRCVGHLLVEDVVNHLCGHTGNGRTGDGACCSPKHLRRGDRETAWELRNARETFKAAGAEPCFG